MCKGMFSAAVLGGLLTACSAVAPPTDLEPDLAFETYRVTVVNEATVEARVLGMRGRVVHAFGGFRAVLPVEDEHREQVLQIEVGSYRFVTMGFWPNPTTPCFHLIVRQPPRLPDGPWPAKCER